MCFYHDGEADIYKVKPVRARKTHRCYECQRAIQPGEPYLRHFQVYEGEPFSCAVCRDCAYVRQLIHDLEIANGCREWESRPAWGELDTLMGDYGDEYPEALAAWKQPAPASFVITEAA